MSLPDLARKGPHDSTFQSRAVAELFFITKLSLKMFRKSGNSQYLGLGIYATGLPCPSQELPHMTIFHIYGVASPNERFYSCL